MQRMQHFRRDLCSTRFYDATLFNTLVDVVQPDFSIERAAVNAQHAGSLCLVAVCLPEDADYSLLLGLMVTDSCDWIKEGRLIYTNAWCRIE